MENKIFLMGLVCILLCGNWSTNNLFAQYDPQPPEFTLLAPLADSQGILIDTLPSPQELISNTFLGSACFDVSNVEIIGNEKGFGRFSQGESTIGLKEGLLISTGDPKDAQGPNETSNLPGSCFDTDNFDPDLEQMTQDSSMHDVIGIEFDFTPTVHQVSFRFVFASEEYCEFTNTEINDAMGIFISGPGINGPFSNNAKNIALLPDTNVFISVNTVNHLENSNYFLPNSEPCGANTDLSGIEYDGFTVVLTATANVIACESYHLKIVLADFGDCFLDSGLFLEAGSFFTNHATVQAVVPSDSSNYSYEGCGDAYFKFTRTSAINIDSPLVVSYYLGGTATMGVDYAPIPETEITIPAGQMEYFLPVEVLTDNQPEGMELLTLTPDI